jgi:hypothetical protein
MDGGTQFRFTQEYSVPQAKPQKLIPVPESDWKRLRRMVSEVVPTSTLFQILWPLLAGICVAGIGVLVTLRTATGPIPNTSWTVAWSSTIASAVGAIICFVADSKQRKSTGRTVESVLTEMKTIEDNYEDIQKNIQDPDIPRSAMTS